jgi:type IV pilus assembly protein PilM
MVRDLRSLLRRTGARLAGEGPRADEPADLSALPEPSDVLAAAPRPAERFPPLGERLRQLSSRRAEWVRSLSTGRQTVALSGEGATLRLLSFSNGKVVGWASMPLDERGWRGGQIQDPLAMGMALEEAFDRFALPRQRVAWALPGFQATTRVLDLPRLRGDELKAAVTEEMDRALGAGAADCYLYWQRLTGRIRQRTVFVLAIPRTTVLTSLEALEAANLRPLTMDLRPLALARGVGRPDAIVVNLEDGSLDLVVVERGLPTLVRSLPLLGAAALREAAQNRLVEETERSLAYYDDLNPDHPLDVDVPVYLTGSLATGIALAERLRAVTRHPIGRLAVPVQRPPDFPLTDYLVNLGLALKQA